MSRPPRGFRQPAWISPSVKHRLDAYELMAGFAGVAVLASPLSVNARVVFTPIHHFIGLGEHYPLDLNHDGIPDFTIVHSVDNTGTSCTYSVWLSARPQLNNGVAGSHTRYGGGNASVLKHGARIGPKFYFQPRGFMAGQSRSAGCDYSRGGRWFNVKNHYLGLSFDIDGKTHYGWARFTVTESRFSISPTLTGYAFETRPKQYIVAAPPAPSTGSASSSIPSVPKPLWLGILAAGVRGRTPKSGFGAGLKTVSGGRH